jgi:hypothetical protein
LRQTWGPEDNASDASAFPRFLDRTLYEVYFPSMDDDFFKIRYRDQVVSKEYRKMAGKNHEDVPIMMVPQI